MFAQGTPAYWALLIAGAISWALTWGQHMTFAARFGGALNEEWFQRIAVIGPPVAFLVGVLSLLLVAVLPDERRRQWAGNFAATMIVILAVASLMFVIGLHFGSWQRSLTERQQVAIGNALRRAHVAGTVATIWQTSDMETKRYAEDLSKAFFWAKPLKQESVREFPVHEKDGVWLAHTGSDELATQIFEAICSAVTDIHITEVEGLPPDSVTIWVGPNPKRP